MADDYVPDALRKRVADQARHRCGYCLRTEELAGMPMTIDHIVPLVAGGATVEENLWLACSRCNAFKRKQTSAQDPQTKETISLFNPRTQVWEEHFGWSEDGTLVIGKTACGRATLATLQMNNTEIVVTRRFWVSAGWWPPQE